MENYYKKLPTEFRTNHHNPNKGKLHNIDVPFRILITGPTGSGKTNCLMALLKIFSGTFGHIYLCVKSTNEPLYKWLIKKLGEDITVYENGEVPPLDTIDKDGEQLVIFDDLVNKKSANKQIEEYFERARKKDMSCVYLTQSYYKTPKFFRDNISHLIIKKVNSKKDLRLILNEHPFDLSIEQLTSIYNNCTKDIKNMMLIDIINHKIYHNFNKCVF